MLESSEDSSCETGMFLDITIEENEFGRPHNISIMILDPEETRAQLDAKVPVATESIVKVNSWDDHYKARLRFANWLRHLREFNLWTALKGGDFDQHVRTVLGNIDLIFTRRLKTAQRMLELCEEHADTVTEGELRFVKGLVFLCEGMSARAKRALENY